MKNLFIILSLFFGFIAQSKTSSINLSQKEKGVYCVNDDSSFSITITEDDKKITTSEGSIYDSVEYLDSGILLKNEIQHAFFQLTVKDQALFIKGDLIEITENFCRDTGASKTCNTKKNGSGESIYWSSEKLNFNDLKTNVTHYGVHPNDGTYFIGINQTNAVAVLDKGSDLKIISGAVKKLTCKHQ